MKKYNESIKFLDGYAKNSYAYIGHRFAMARNHYKRVDEERLEGWRETLDIIRKDLVWYFDEIARTTSAHLLIKKGYGELDRKKLIEKYYINVDIGIQLCYNNVVRGGDYNMKMTNELGLRIKKTNPVITQDNHEYTFDVSTYVERDREMIAQVTMDATLDGEWLEEESMCWELNEKIDTKNYPMMLELKELYGL